ncbi:YciI family protein [Actinoplanes sp. M2I2]|uniref:YciI family protein n=1 Tax=Actinoplanes sp. M2I2 TaxID=1734444 RepID=UPI00202140AE|nr:YciI family protein [Actinoplanes sp. M2I2]
MKFALLYQYDPTQAGPADGEVQDWLEFDKHVRDAGSFVYEAGFHPADAARWVTVRDGVSAVDGAGGRPGQAVAGLYVVDVADLDAATALAEQLPTARYGAVEVREVVDYAG